MTATPEATTTTWWHRMRDKLTDAGSFRGWTLSANDGIIVTATLAFMLGAAIPLLISWLVPFRIEDTVIVLAVIASLIATSIVASRAGHLTLWRVLARSLAVGVGTMAVSYVAGLALF